MTFLESEAWLLPSVTATGPIASQASPGPAAFSAENGWVAMCPCLREQLTLLPEAGTRWTDFVIGLYAGLFMQASAGRISQAKTLIAGLLSTLQVSGSETGRKMYLRTVPSPGQT